MLKHLVGRGHPEFSTMRQQDAFEFLQHMFKLITRSQHKAPLRDPVEAFKFVAEQKLKCLNCQKVRYRTDEQDNISVPVPMRKLPEKPVVEGEEKAKDEYEAITLEECLDIFTGVEMVELTCPACNSKDGFYKQTFFKTFPEVLAVNARRFNIVNWVPIKLDIPVVVGDEPFSLDKYKSPPRSENEELLPEEETSSTPSFVPNAVALQELQMMGFPHNRCERGLHATGNTSADAAMEWLFAHMEDADIDEPLVLAAAPSSSATVDPASLEMLSGMGFTEPQAKKALKETGGDMERAVEWLFSHPDDQGDFGDAAPPADDTGAKKEVPGSDGPAKFQLSSIVCHKGGSIHAGHYVAFIRKNLAEDAEEGESSNSKEWVLFNDEKVVKASDVEEMKKFAYVYFFERM